MVTFKRALGVYFFVLFCAPIFSQGSIEDFLLQWADGADSIKVSLATGEFTTVDGQTWVKSMETTTVLSYDSGTKILSYTDEDGALYQADFSTLEDSDGDPDNELNINLALNGNTLELTDAGGTLTTNLSGYLDNTDDQTLSYTAPNVSIENGNSIDITTGLSLSDFNDDIGAGNWDKIGNYLKPATANDSVRVYSPTSFIELTGDNVFFNSANSGLLPLDIQTYSKDLNIGTSVYAWGNINTNFGTKALWYLTGNEIMSLDNKGLKLQTVTGLNSINKILVWDTDKVIKYRDLSSFSITDIDTAGLNIKPYQDLSISDNTLSLSGDASPVDLSGYLDNTDDQTLSEVLAQGNSAGAKITNLTDPTLDQDAATKAYVDASTSATWTTSGANIYNSNAGNVGIGTATPTAKAEINGTLIVSDDANFDNATLFVDASANNTGIGTVAPRAKLEVNSAAGLDFLLASTSGNPDLSFAETDATRAQIKYDITNNGLSFYTDETPTSITGLSGTPDMFLKAGGNVGIGTLNPTQKLHVVGKIRQVDGSQGVDKILVSDANGVATWTNPTTKTNIITQYHESTTTPGGTHKEGDVWKDTDDDLIKIYDGANWQTISDLGTGGGSSDYISGVTYSGDTLIITGTGAAFDGSILLPNLGTGPLTNNQGTAADFNMNAQSVLFHDGPAFTIETQPVALLENYDDINLAINYFEANRDDGISIHAVDSGGRSRWQSRFSQKSNSSGSPRTAIEYIARDTSNNITTDIEAITILNNGNVGIGDTIPDTKLHVKGNFKLEDGTEGAGKVLVSNASGVASWQANVGTDDQTLSEVLAQGNSAGAKITNLTDPTAAQDAATKAYVDANTSTTDELNTTMVLSGSTLELTDAGGTLSVSLSSIDNQTLSEVLNNDNDATGTKITGLGYPISATDAATKAYVDANTSTTDELNTTMVLSGSTLELTDAGGTLSANLSTISTDDQTLSEVLAQGNSAGAKITNLTDPTAAQDAATKAYVDANDEIGTDDQTLSEVLAQGNSAGAKITNLTDPTAAQDAATKAYVDANDAVDDADNDPTNEIQQIGYNITNGILSIENANSFDLRNAILDHLADVVSSNTEIGMNVEYQTVDNTLDFTASDPSASNELNTGLVMNGNNLELTDPGGTLSVDISSADDQTLSEVLAQGNSAGAKITNLTDPTAAQDAATKAYVDNNFVSNANIALSRMSTAGTTSDGGAGPLKIPLTISTLQRGAVTNDTGTDNRPEGLAAGIYQINLYAEMSGTVTGEVYIKVNGEELSAATSDKLVHTNSSADTIGQATTFFIDLSTNNPDISSAAPYYIEPWVRRRPNFGVIRATRTSLEIYRIDSH